MLSYQPYEEYIQIEKANMPSLFRSQANSCVETMSKSKTYLFGIKAAPSQSGLKCPSIQNSYTIHTNVFATITISMPCMSGLRQRFDIREPFFIMKIYTNIH